MFFSCKYKTVRLKQGYRYFYCRYKNNIIGLDECKSCSNTILRANKAIKKKSNKLTKLEKTRKEKTDSSYCYYCHRFLGTAGDIHEIYGGSNRKRSIKNGFVVKLCRECHQDETKIANLRIRFQKMYEKNHTREEFIKLFGKSYL
jgi:hypothetical protein